MTSNVAMREMDPALIYHFDVYSDPTLLCDIHQGYWHLKEAAPPIFWTPANGGHWVVTDADGIIDILRRPETFSNRALSIPYNHLQPHIIPQTLDPPEHRPYRQLLRPYFDSKAIAPLAPRVAQWTETLIDRVADAGECEFVEALSTRLPVSIFMELFGFPLDELDEFRGLIVTMVDVTTDQTTRVSVGTRVSAKITDLISARRAERRDDLMSELIDADFQGRKLDDGELRSIGILMFLAGLDTVVNAMSFGMRHLAGDATLRQRMIDDPACIPDVVEELLRRYAFVSVPRYVSHDTDLLGAALRKGDMVFVPLVMVGWDESRNACPHIVDIDRKSRHAAFGSGNHTCLGLHLARLELITFYRIWFSRIGHFRIAERSAPPAMRAGMVQALENLHLAWEVRTSY